MIIYWYHRSENVPKVIVKTSLEEVLCTLLVDMINVTEESHVSVGHRWLHHLEHTLITKIAVDV
jgi:uncharacterized ferritin-like protein (DUF455 family)